MGAEATGRRSHSGRKWIRRLASARATHFGSQRILRTYRTEFLPVSLGFDTLAAGRISCLRPEPESQMGDKDAGTPITRMEE